MLAAGLAAGAGLLSLAGVLLDSLGEDESDVLVSVLVLDEESLDDASAGRLSLR